MSRESEEYAAMLFDDERMQLRSDIFLGVSVPIYQSWQERFDYRHIVHFSSDLPEKWRTRLEDAANRYPCLLLDEVTDTIATNSVIIADVAARGTEADVVVRIRVDDDDVLAADYLDVLDSYVIPEHVGYVVSFWRGIAALYEEGRHTDFRFMRESLPSAGQAFIGRFDRESQALQGIRDVAHNRADTVGPVIVDSRAPMYLQTHHAQQDKKFGDADDSMTRLQRFPAYKDFVTLNAKFPTLADSNSPDLIG